MRYATGRPAALTSSTPSGIRQRFSFRTASQWKEILAALRTLSVLTVSDIPQFARHGGIIQFLLDGNRVRFDINLAATDRVGVKLSSELLKLAVTVSRSP